MTFRSILDTFSKIKRLRSGDLIFMDKPMDKPTEVKPGKQAKNTQLFDFIVLIGMVLNMLLAVFLVLYYFDLL